MHTVPVRGAASAAQDAHSGAQTPLGSEALHGPSFGCGPIGGPYAMSKVKEADEIKLTSLP